MTLSIFKQTEEYLCNHGWEKINKTTYSDLKLNRKNETARIGRFTFFKLKKSNEQIKNERALDEFAEKLKEKYKRMFDSHESINWIIDEVLREVKE